MTAGIPSGSAVAIRQFVSWRPRTPTDGTCGAAISLGSAREAADLRVVAARSPFTISWGGLVVVGADERAADAKAARLSPGPAVIVGGPERVADALRGYVDAGADWLVIGPVDSSNPENAAILGELVSPLLRG